MANIILNPLASRLKLFVHDFSNESVEMKNNFDKLVEEKNGDWEAIRTKLIEDATPELVAKLDFTNKLANWTGESEAVVRLFQKDKNTNSMRDIALRFNKATLARAFLKLKDLPKEGDSAEAKAAVVEEDLYKKLFHLEPTAMLINMVKDIKVPLLNDAVGANVVAVLEKHPDFNLKTTSIYEIVKNEEAFKEVLNESIEPVKSALKSLQRIVAVSPIPDAIQVLYNAKLLTAFQISELPPSQFMVMMKDKGLDEPTISQIHFNAQNTRVRNEQALNAIREVGMSTNVDMIDKSLKVNNKENKAIKNRTSKYSNLELVNDILKKYNLSWDLIFIDSGFCECGESNSAYTAATYYLELLQYLIKNNLVPENTRNILRAPKK